MMPEAEPCPSDGKVCPSNVIPEWWPTHCLMVGCSRLKMYRGKTSQVYYPGIRIELDTAGPDAPVWERKHIETEPLLDREIILILRWKPSDDVPEHNERKWHQFGPFQVIDRRGDESDG